MSGLCLVPQRAWLLEVVSSNQGLRDQRPTSKVCQVTTKAKGAGPTPGCRFGSLRPIYQGLSANSNLSENTGAGGGGSHDF